MDTFAPESCRFWLPTVGEDGARQFEAANDDDVGEREALAELVERVNAARSVV